VVSGALLHAQRYGLTWPGDHIIAGSSLFRRDAERALGLSCRRAQYLHAFLIGHRMNFAAHHGLRGGLEVGDRHVVIGEEQRDSDLVFALGGGCTLLAGAESPELDRATGKTDGDGQLTPDWLSLPLRLFPLSTQGSPRFRSDGLTVGSRIRGLAVMPER
jgi:hypothetical protein